MSDHKEEFRRTLLALMESKVARDARDAARACGLDLKISLIGPKHIFPKGRPLSDYIVPEDWPDWPDEG